MQAQGNSLLKVAFWFFAIGLLILVAFCLWGCGKREKELSTGQVIPAAQLPLAGFRGDTAYATVNSSSLPSLYANFRDVLSKQGLVKWDSRFDCNHFAALYVALSQAQFTVAAWQSETKAQTLALAEVWYRRGGLPDQGHAIIAAQTERGLIFVEPQTGQELVLSPVELANIYLVKW